MQCTVIGCHSAERATVFYKGVAAGALWLNAPFLNQYPRQNPHRHPHQHPPQFTQRIL